MTEATYTMIRLVQAFKGIESRDVGPWEERITMTFASYNGTKVALTPV